MTRKKTSVEHITPSGFNVIMQCYEKIQVEIIKQKQITVRVKAHFSM